MAFARTLATVVGSSAAAAICFVAVRLSEAQKARVREAEDLFPPVNLQWKIVVGTVFRLHRGSHLMQHLRATKEAIELAGGKVVYAGRTILPLVSSSQPGTAGDWDGVLLHVSLTGAKTDRSSEELTLVLVLPKGLAKLAGFSGGQVTKGSTTLCHNFRSPRGCLLVPDVHYRFSFRHVLPASACVALPVADGVAGVVSQPDHAFQEGAEDPEICARPN